MATQGVEVERKFLVDDVDAALAGAEPGLHLVQGYLEQTGDQSVRIRCWADDSRAVLTVKGPRSGMSRPEAECEVSPEVAELLLAACGGRVVDKTRHVLAAGDADGVQWILDVFHGANTGLVLAEAELTRADATIAPAPWCGRDVTEDDRYYNDHLSRRPFTTWS